MGPDQPGFLENMWVTTKYFHKKNPVSLVRCVSPVTITHNPKSF